MVQQDAIFMQKFEDKAQFTSVKEMDDNVKTLLTQFSAQLNKTDAAVLDYLKQRATRVIGVAYTKVATIAAAIEKSVRTVNYSTSKLENLGIIKKLEVMREKAGGYGANGYLILNCSSNCSTQIAVRDEAEKPCESKSEQPKIESTSLYSFNSFKSSKEKELKKSVKAAPIKIQPALFSNIPERIKQSLSLLQDNELGNAIWKKVIQAYVQSDLYNIANNMHLQKLIEEDEMLYANLVTKIHNVVYAHAHGKVRTDVKGFIYGTCKGHFNDLSFEYYEANAPEIDLDTHYENVAARLTAQQTVQSHTTHYERPTAAELDELGVY
jgi:DNA-binding Lrp family transcriptional regulator